MNITETLLWNLLYWTLYLPLSLLVAPDANPIVLVGSGAFCTVIFTAIITRKSGMLMSARETAGLPFQESLPEPVQDRLSQKRCARSPDKKKLSLEVNHYAKEEHPNNPTNEAAESRLRPSNTTVVPVASTDSNIGLSADNRTSAIE